MKRILIPITIISLLLASCTFSSDNETSTNTDLLDNSSSILMQTDYDTKTNECSGETYELYLSGDVAKFYYSGEIDGYLIERQDDFAISKYQELIEIIKSSDYSEYDINNHIDNNGKIEYEVLETAIIVSDGSDNTTPASNHLLEIKDSSDIQQFFINLRDISQTTYSSDSSLEDAINMDLVSGQISQDDVDISEMIDYAVNGGGTMTINLKDSGDGELHYAVLRISLSQDSTNKDYTEKYSAGLNTYDNIISDTIKTVVSNHTIEDMRSNEDEVKEEILEALQGLFKSSFIVRVNFSSATYQ